MLPCAILYIEECLLCYIYSWYTTNIIQNRVNLSKKDLISFQSNISIAMVFVCTTIGWIKYENVWHVK